MSDEPIQDLRKIQPAPLEPLPVGDAETPAHIEAPERAPDHPRWIRKLRSAGGTGAAGAGLTAALGYVSPSMLASVGIANPWVAAGLMAGVTAVQGVVGYYTKSDPRDFPKAEALPTEEVRRALREEGSKHPDSSIQGPPTPKRNLSSTAPSTMPTPNQAVPAASDAKASAKEEAVSIFNDAGDAEAFGRLVDGLADLPSALEALDGPAAEKAYQLAINALDADPSK